MIKIEKMLTANETVSDYKINVTKKESFEYFFVKGKLETARATDTCDREVTIYVRHGDFIGQSQFFIYPSTTESDVERLIEDGVKKALLINNKPFELPANDAGEFTLQSNFSEMSPTEAARTIADTVFAANTVEGGSLNSVEIFINKYVESVKNSRGVDKTQTRYTAMVEAIPTFNGETQSVELYEQYNFSSLSIEELTAEIREKMAEVSARYHATTPAEKPACPVMLKPLELRDLFWGIADDLSFATAYQSSNRYSLGDALQNESAIDKINITLSGKEAGNCASREFDSDGMALTPAKIVENGVATARHGANRFAQYMNEAPTGVLECLTVENGTLSEKDLENTEYLEVLSMSGLQLDLFNDYIGGEIRLALHHKDGKKTPVTGISFSGELGEFLDGIRLADTTAKHGSYAGPAFAYSENVKIF